MTTSIPMSLALAALLSAAEPAPAPAPTKATTATTAPKAATTEAVSFRQQKPATAPRKATPLPKPQSWRDDTSGLEVALIEAHDLPTVSVSLVFETGAVDDPAQKPGLTSLAMALMSQGTVALDKIAFEERQADIASSVSIGAGLETTSAGASTLKKNLEPTLELLLGMLRTPGMRQDDLARLVAQRKAAIAQSRGAPQSVGGRVMGSIQFPGHAYGAIETEATVDSITLDELKATAARLGPHGARLTVTGDMTRAEVDQLIATRFAPWPGGLPVKRSPSSLPKPRPGTVFFVDVPGAPQSLIAVMASGPARTAADYETTELMAQILGGSFSSRINMNLREKNGYAYGARAGYRYRRQAGSFAATSSVRTDATGKALRELHNELMAMRNTVPETTELERDRSSLVLSLPAQFSTPRRLADAYGELAFFGLPKDWYDGRVARLQQPTAAAIQAQAQKLLPTTGYQVLVVGDAKVIRAEVEAIATEGLFGPKSFVVLDVDGNVVPGGARQPAVTSPPALRATPSP